MITWILLLCYLFSDCFCKALYINGSIDIA
jgi:hypothetical protein